MGSRSCVGCMAPAIFRSERALVGRTLLVQFVTSAARDCMARNATTAARVTSTVHAEDRLEARVTTASTGPVCVAV